MDGKFVSAFDQSNVRIYERWCIMVRRRDKVLFAVAALSSLLNITSESSVRADTILSETFDGESYGYDKDSLAGKFEVISGRVDVIGPGTPPYDFFPGHGKYLDLTGSPTAGTIRTKDDVPFVVGKTYTVSFELGDTPSNTQPAFQSDQATITIDIEGISNTYTFGPLDPKGFSTKSFTFVSTAGPGKITISESDGSNDYRGVLLNDFKVVAVPVPNAMIGGASLLGLAGAGLFLKRRRALI